MLSFLRSQRSEMVKLTAELIAIPTENPPGNRYSECHKLLMSRLKQLGFTPRVHGESVLAFWGTGQRTLYFHGHYDVVSGAEPGPVYSTNEGGEPFWTRVVGYEIRPGGDDLCREGAGRKRSQARWPHRPGAGSR